MIGPYALAMRTPALMALAALPLLLGSCTTLSSFISTDPAVDSAGPLVVGQTLSVTGIIDGGNVSASVPVPQLVNVVGGRGTVSDRDRIDALQRGRSGFTSASYLNTNAENVTLIWIGDAVNGAAPQYTCSISTLTKAPYSGVLTLRRGANSYTGTCSADLQ